MFELYKPQVIMAAYSKVHIFWEVKIKGKISQNFVAFSEYMNFKWFNFHMKLIIVDHSVLYAQLFHRNVSSNYLRKKEYVCKFILSRDILIVGLLCSQKSILSTENGREEGEGLLYWWVCIKMNFSLLMIML